MNQASNKAENSCTYMMALESTFYIKGRDQSKFDSLLIASDKIQYIYILVQLRVSYVIKIKTNSTKL